MKIALAPRLTALAIVAGALLAPPATQAGFEPSSYDLTESSSQGTRYVGEQGNSFTGFDTAELGDLNGDKVDDYAITAYGLAPLGRQGAGITYVVWGKKGDTRQDIQLSTLGLPTGRNTGYRIFGAEENDNSGWAVTQIGDVNGDGKKDLAIGAPSHKFEYYTEGAVYVVYSKADSSTIDLRELEQPNNNKGYVIHGTWGPVLGDGIGHSMASLGDINGDSKSDMAIGCRPGGNCAYVVYGKTGGAPISLYDVAANGEGFEINGTMPDYENNIPGEVVGGLVDKAGDVNGDGRTDIIVGMPERNNFAGGAFVLFGRPPGASDVNVTEPGAGFLIDNSIPNESHGTRVAGVGDVNGDGRSDVAIGAQLADSGKGRVDVVFGKSSTTPVETSSLDTAGGFRIVGRTHPIYPDAGDNLGIEIKNAGDYNRDGKADIAIGASGAEFDLFNRYNQGAIFVVFGRSTSGTIPTDQIGPNGFAIWSRFPTGRVFGDSITMLPDGNKDGFQDLLISDSSEYADGPGDVTLGGIWLQRTLPNPEVTYPAGTASVTVGSPVTVSPTNLTYVQSVNATVKPKLPKGLQISSQTGVVSGTPTVGKKKAVTYKVTVSDLFGESTSQFKLEVRP